ncbi:hypothetical protein [Nocardioides luteus]|uniref:hypothetical protein n=1 Tax=Nocardioides luteus TaxID=1844 RepID=UPI0018CB57B7|nr:hypothetical protein [Nocardioides luteus]MBG6099063.1 hypothetical protein [Nocardioides luteus]
MTTPDNNDELSGSTAATGHDPVEDYRAAYAEKLAEAVRILTDAAQLPRPPALPRPATTKPLIPRRVKS